MARHLLLGAAAAALVFAAPAAAQSVAITNAKLVVGDGGQPVDGTVVIRDGRVVAAGPGVAVPAGMRVIDAGGKWVSPGIFAGFTRMGIVEVDAVEQTNDTAAGSSPFNAALDVTPAVNPLTSAIAINRAEGVTRAVVAPSTSKGSIFAGQGAVIDLGSDLGPVARPRAFQFMEYGEGGAQAAGGSRPAAYAMLKNALFEVRDYIRAPARFADRGRDALLTRADADALVPVVQGRVPLLIHVERASDILVVLELKREFPTLRLVLVGASEGWMVAPQIAAAKVPVMATALSDLPSSFEMLAATQSNIGRMQSAGVLVGIGTINQDEARQARWAKQYAGNLVALGRIPGASGLDWGAAFASISSKPAEVMGMGADYGSLRPGRRGDVVIWDGDPLEIGSSAVNVFIDGVEQSLASRQSRLRDRYWEPKERALPKAYEH